MTGIWRVWLVSFPNRHDDEFDDDDDDDDDNNNNVERKCLM